MMWVQYVTVATIMFSVVLVATGSELRPHTITCHEASGDCDVPLLAFVPCIHGNTSVGVAEECDVFVFAAIVQAMEDVNRNRSFVRRSGRREYINLKLHLSHIVTQENAFKTLFSFFSSRHAHAWSSLGMVGPSNNIVTEIMAYIFGQKLPAVTVSYGATDILFANLPGCYSNLYSTVPSERALNMARIALLNKMGWKKIAIATSTTDHTHTRAAEQLAMLSNRSSISVTLHHIEGLSMDASLVFNEWTAARTKIIVALLRPLEARRVLCQAARLNSVLLDLTHVWLLPHYYTPLWWQIDHTSLSALPGDQACSNTEMAIILRGMYLLVLDSLNYNIPAIQDGMELQDNIYTLEHTVYDVVDHVMERASRLSPGLPLSATSLRQSQWAAAYDSVWTLVLAYHRIAMETNDFTLDNVTKEIESLTFRGLAKDHSLGSREAQDFAAKAFVGQYIDGVLQPVMLINSSSCVNMTSNISLPGFTTYVSSFKWRGGVVPSDGITEVNSVIPLTMLLSAVLLSVIATSLCIAMLIAMVVFWNNKHIKSTSPRYMLLAMLSCMTVLPSGILYGLSFSAVEYRFCEASKQFLCIVEYPLFSVGQQVAVAVFVAKSWRVYRIFYNYQQSSEVTGIGPRYLNAIISVISSLYILLIILWLVIDTPLPSKTTIPLSSSVDLHLSHCFNDSTFFSNWKIALVLYTVLILLLLGYLSFKNTKIKDQRFKEEGQSSARLAIAIIVSYLVLAILVITSLDSQQRWLPRHVQMFWSLTTYSTLSPVVFFGVLFIPKYARIYRDYRTKKKEKGDMSNIINLMLTERDTLKSDLDKKKERIEFLRSRSSTLLIQ